MQSIARSVFRSNDCIEMKSIEEKNAFEDNNQINGDVIAETNRSAVSVVPIKDRFCWICHRSDVESSCAACLRSYHHKCCSFSLSADGSRARQLCPECVAIESAEEGTNPSILMQWLNGSVERLSQLLAYTIETVKAADKKQSFVRPVREEDYPEYHKIVVNPIDLSLVEDNIQKKVYASTNSFLADIKWIYHNCVVFNSGVNNRVITEAKNVIRVAKQECEEIEICPDCYLNYYTLEEETYFAAVCGRPHAIVWAKLKGHPFWPAKVVRLNEQKNEVDIRFFGTHDKCWLKPEKCYLMSQNYPNSKKPTKFDQSKFDAAIRDMNAHLDELDKRFKGLFQFHEKQTIFTIDKLYLKYDDIPNQLTSLTEKKTSQQSNQSNESDPFNGTPLRNLKLRVTPFDVIVHIDERSPAFDIKSPPTKRFKRNFINVMSIARTKCISSAIPVRQELNSSVEESDKEMSIGDKEDQESNNERHSDENDRRNGLDSKSSQLKTKTVTVSGKSSETLNLNKTIEGMMQLLDNQKDESVKDIERRDSTENSTIANRYSGHRPHLRLLPDRIGNFINMVKVWNIIQSDLEIREPRQRVEECVHYLEQKLNSNEDLMKRVKNLEFRNRQMTEELSDSKRKMMALEEEKDELKKTNEELINSIEDIKRKQWCTNCLKEGILPCCWNTCYCTIECQHQHWPLHSKTCRRRQQQIENRT